MSTKFPWREPDIRACPASLAVRAKCKVTFLSLFKDPTSQRIYQEKPSLRSLGDLGPIITYYNPNPSTPCLSAQQARPVLVTLTWRLGHLLLPR